MTRALLLFAAVLGSLAVAAVRADADSVGTLQVNGTFTAKYNHGDCPGGSPATASCFLEVASAGRESPAPPLTAAAIPRRRASSSPSNACLKDADRGRSAESDQ